MTSSWTVALFYQQLRRYAEIIRRAGRPEPARQLEALAVAVREDFNRFLVHDGTVAGYAVFATDGHLRELLLHPSDRRTGISYSLLPMAQGILGGLFTPEQVRHHRTLIRDFLTFPDGVRLMDKPIAYRGGIEAIFRRAESSAFFGREIGLMYVHAHLRYAEAMAVLRDSEAFREALVLANPIAVTKHLAHASLRQRNTYFTSSDATFPDRYRASEEWDRVRTGKIPVEAGWRVYSSGPGLFISLFIRYVLGIRRHFGRRIIDPLPAIPLQ
jgi:cellobiose phosphorylase